MASSLRMSDIAFAPRRQTTRPASQPTSRPAGIYRQGQPLGRVDWNDPIFKQLGVVPPNGPSPLGPPLVSPRQSGWDPELNPDFGAGNIPIKDWVLEAMSTPTGMVDVGKPAPEGPEGLEDWIERQMTPESEQAGGFPTWEAITAAVVLLAVTRGKSGLRWLGKRLGIKALEKKAAKEAAETAANAVIKEGGEAGGKQLLKEIGEQTGKEASPGMLKSILWGGPVRKAMTIGGSVIGGATMLPRTIGWAAREWKDLPEYIRTGKTRDDKEAEAQLKAEMELKRAEIDQRAQEVRVREKEIDDRNWANLVMQLEGLESERLKARMQLQEQWRSEENQAMNTRVRSINELLQYGR